MYSCDTDIPFLNCTPEDYTQFILGPRMLPLYKTILVSIIYGIIFITGILGNVLVCVVIAQHEAMHTATNYYLFSLAVSDLLYLLLGLPTEIFLYWHQYPYLFGQFFCSIRAFISEACTYVSVFTIVAFSTERFLAICHPLYSHTMVGFKRALRIIITLWIVSFICAIPFGMKTGIQYLRYPLDNSRIADSAFCSISTEFINHVPLFEISFVVFFIVPMVLIILLYGRMGIQIKARTPNRLGAHHGSTRRDLRRSQRKNKSVIRMLSAVVITFFVCWLPFHIQRLWYLYAQKYESYQNVNEWLFSIAGVAYYISCTINPILYNMMSGRYRKAFKDILRRKKSAVYFNKEFLAYKVSFRENSDEVNLESNLVVP